MNDRHSPGYGCVWHDRDCKTLQGLMAEKPLYLVETEYMFYNWKRAAVLFISAQNVFLIVINEMWIYF
jgi:hypothetical protein